LIVDIVLTERGFTLVDNDGDLDLFGFVVRQFVKPCVAPSLSARRAEGKENGANRGRQKLQSFCPTVLKSYFHHLRIVAIVSVS
jgi:hypothetical protein